MRQYINAVNTFIRLHQIILLYIKTVEIYCVSCKKIVKKNSRVRRTKQNRLMPVSNCAVCSKKKSSSLKIKKQVDYGARKLYGSAKVHKPIIDNCPSFRPILSAIGTPTYNLAKFLVPILSPLTVSEFTVYDSFSFAEEVVNFDANCTMASLEVESLFTSIPLDETIENCINDLFSNNDTVHNFIKEDIKELLKFAFYESFFTFDNEYYSQLDGVTMGYPLGPTLANA